MKQAFTDAAKIAVCQTASHARTFFRLNSLTRASSGVIVAHFMPTLYFCAKNESTAKRRTQGCSGCSRPCFVAIQHVGIFWTQESLVQWLLCLPVTPCQVYTHRHTHTHIYIHKHTPCIYIKTLCIYIPTHLDGQGSLFCDLRGKERMENVEHLKSRTNPSPANSAGQTLPYTFLICLTFFFHSLFNHSPSLYFLPIFLYIQVHPSSIIRHVNWCQPQQADLSFVHAHTPYRWWHLGL